MTMLSGWGNYPRAEVPLLQARGGDAVREIVAAQSSVIARGNGRAYGDAALNTTATLSMLRSDRILAFDAAAGVITCEAGVMLADMLQIIMPKGWFVPVTPGTKYVTIGGMIAADVHGKNHHQAGSFCNHVQWLTLLLADGQIVTCSAQEQAELFAATCGGMGLTGVILSACVALRPIETAWITQQTVRTTNLAETMAIFAQHAAASYSVAWLDCLAGGEALGRSVVYLGEHAPRSALPSDASPWHVPARKLRIVPVNLPAWGMHRRNIAAANAVYYARAKPGERLVDYDRFFYPLDALRQWNRLYGRKGFVQYQCVLPLAVSAEGIAALLARVQRAGLGSFLAVLKPLGAGNRFLSFPMSGYTLALDFPVSPKVLTLLSALDALVAEYGGRMYLAKDARMDARMMQFYPEYAAFQEVLQRVDPMRKFASLQSQRLGVSWHKRS